MVRLQSATVEEPGEKKNLRRRCGPRTFCLNGSAVASVAAFSKSSLVMLMKVEHRSRIAQKPPQFPWDLPLDPSGSGPKLRRRSRASMRMQQHVGCTSIPEAL